MFYFARERFGFCSISVSTNSPTNCSTICVSDAEGKSPEPSERLEDVPDESQARVGPKEVLHQWGCSNDDISKLIARRPSLLRANPTLLESKLTILNRLGITGPDLVKVIHCRPRFLGCCINRHLEERIEFFTCLFGSKEMLRKAVIRNPSLLTYDFHHKIKPIIELYENMGVAGENLVSMLLSRPTMIPRTSFDEDKMEYIHRIGVSPTSKMYKYVVTIIGISRLETIRQKVTNFERFGFSEDEVLTLFGRSPLLLTLSVEKIQRNMTFLLGTMKVPAKAIVQYPFLLYCNLEAVLKPRMALAGKIQDMGLHPEVKGPIIFRAFRMTETRFLNFFVRCHPKDVADELMVLYNNAKCVKRLAETSKKCIHKGFPF